MILFPAIDLKDGQCVRLKLGDMATGDRLQRRSRRAGESLRGPGFRVAACGRSQRRLRRRERQRRGGRGDPEGDEESGAARRRHPHAGADRGLARQGPGPRHPRHGRGARSGPGEGGLPAVSRQDRRRHRRRGGKVAVEGWAEASTLGVDRTGAEIRGRRRRGHHLHRHRPRRRAGRHQLGIDASRWPTPSRSRSSPRAGWPRSTTSCA